MRSGSGNTLPASLAEKWDGKAWTITPVPNGGAKCWAAGSARTPPTGSSKTLTERNF